MDSIFSVINPNWLITMAIPVSNWFGQWHDFEFLADHIDFFNAMTYGTHGDWSNHVGHLAPLYASPPGDPDGSCDTNMDYLHNSRNIPKEKINMGMPFWGLKWDSSNINEPFTANTVDIFYYDIPELIDNGWSYNWDPYALCPYLIKDDGTQVITYENPQSIGLKCEYVSEQGLGGVMIWALAYDQTSNGQELIQSINENYLSKDQNDLPIIPEFISFSAYPNPFNPICNIEFQLPQSQFIKIRINDILGNEIKILNNNILSKGDHQFLWDANTYPSGSYFINIEHDKYIHTQMVTLIK